MLLISEWLPNPKGNDTEGEWIEIANIGTTPVNIAGYQIAASKSRKPYVFPARTLTPGEHYVLHRNASKLSLRNADETLTLTAPNGTIADTSKFVGTASEGKSLSRFGERFVFTVPTPGAKNEMSQAAAVLTQYPVGLITTPPSSLDGIAMAIAVGIGLAVTITSIMVRNAELYHLFFGGDNASRSRAR